MLSKVEKEQLKVPAHIDYLGDLRDFVTQIGKKHGFPDKVVNAFKLAVDEAATNIIRHAYRDNEGLITIRSIVRKNSLTLCIIDQGAYFDPKRVKDPDLNRYIDIGKKGGLGIFIIRKLMDEIDYRKTEEGNELRITKFMDKPVKERLVKTVSAIPVSIKAKFFFRAIAIITLIIALGYLYFYLKADDQVIMQFMEEGRSTSTQIVNRISAIVTDAIQSDVAFVDGSPIKDDFKHRIYQFSIEDSLGTIVYSTVSDEIYTAYKRPADAELIEPGVSKYLTESGALVYEFESDISLRNSSRKYGKAHLLFSSARMDKQITSNRINDLKLTFFILAFSYFGVTVIIYLLMNPLRKLSAWIKDTGHGEIRDEIDIDTSSELGEIAQAFTDITHKFRESQKNLADQERLQKEMQLAQDIQQTLLPMSFPELDGYELASYYEAAKEVGGDYYDFVEVDKDTLGIAVADVSGKGVPGSLVMTMIRTALRTEARGMKDAAEVLTRVNDFISNDIKKGMFVTVFYLIIDTKRRSINYASAGHNPMILYRNSTKKTYYLNPKGFPIGIQLPEKDLFKKSIESEAIEMAKDDILLLYTDGITEAMNSNRDLFGEERLQDVLRNNGHLSAKEFVEKLKLSIYSFTEGNPQYDDITLVTVKEQSTREADELRRAKEAHLLITQGISIRESCERVNLTTYAYYNKYKKAFEEEGVDAIEINEKESSVEAKHLSIEEKTKIFDIISQHPEYGAGRISEELNTEKYGLEKISENKIYDELVRSRLNTRQLREGYIQRIKSGKRRLKPPGTPLMTLDGTLIMSREDEMELRPIQKPMPRREPPREEKRPKAEPAPESIFDESFESLTTSTPVRVGNQPSSLEIEAESLLDVPIDELLAKNHTDEEEEQLSEEASAPPPELSPPETESTDFETSLHKMFSDSRESEKDAGHSVAEDFDNLELESADSSMLDDLSLQDYFSERPAAEDDDFDEEAADDSGEADREVALVTADEPIVEDTQTKPLLVDDDSEPTLEETIALSGVEEVDESFLMSSEVEELLSERSESDFSASDEDAELATDKNGKRPEGGSFADLIQAIDDEIVYIPGNSKPAVSKFEKRSQNGNGEAAKPSTSLTDREKVLIKGIRYYKNKEYSNAIHEFKKVLKEYPDYKEAHSILGNAYFRNQMYNEAAFSYEKVKELDPNDITAYENLGVIYANRGNYKEAVSEWKKVLEFNPDRADIKEKIKKALRMIHT